jgi:regulatory protein
MADDLAKRLRHAAIQHLSRREHSRHELRAKLVRSLHLLLPEPGSAGSGDATDEAQQVIDRVLDELQAAGWQSDARTVGVRVDAKAAQWGQRRLKADLRRRGLAPDLVAQALAPLAQTELERARALWQRRFPAVAGTPAEQARQARYLAARGFSTEVIRRVLKHPLLDEDAGL